MPIAKYMYTASVGVGLATVEIFVINNGYVNTMG